MIDLLLLGNKTSLSFYMVLRFEVKYILVESLRDHAFVIVSSHYQDKG
jgi:hypothetical protein